MKRINFLLIALSLFIFTACEQEDYEFGDILSPTNLTISASIQGADVDNPYGDGSGYVTFTATAADAITYKFIQDGVEYMVPSGVFSTRFTSTGIHVYSVEVIASGTAGVMSNGSTSVEVLIPDFKGDRRAIDNIINEAPEVLNHNLETVPRLQREIRTAASYGRSLSLLQYAKEVNFSGKTKTGLIVGMGEEFDEVIAVLKDVSQIDIDIVTIGQYLRPTSKHRPIHRYVTQDEFDEYKLIGEKFGIPHIESGPLVRSSYHAKDSFASV